MGVISYFYIIRLYLGVEGRGVFPNRNRKNSNLLAVLISDGIKHSRQLTSGPCFNQEKPVK